MAKSWSTASPISRKRITSIFARPGNRRARQADQEAVATSGTPLLDIDDIGALIAADIPTEVGDSTRFATKAKFALANGTVPFEASSGRVCWHRLDREGNRQLDTAIHNAAITQIAWSDTEGRCYYEKRRIFDGIWIDVGVDIGA